ncbi:EboA domain-containing protein [Verrucomicrobiales bacterium]|nr:EboA domain-containing protein [Verrucomicrobiales bacterium]
MAFESTSALALLESWLASRLSADAQEWYDKKRADLGSDREFFLAFALVPRNLGKADLDLTDQERSACTDWDPSNWTVDQAARIALLLAGPDQSFINRLEKLCATGDVGEQITLYQALILYQNPESLTQRAAEGLRSNVVPVFEAVAHRNPYPQRYFDDAAWNQMVLKALFIGSSLHPIQGLDERANEPLAATLIDSAHERWAAGREVNPELWRCVGPFINTNRLEDVKRALKSDNPLSQEAARLALAASNLPEAKMLLEATEDKVLSWEEIHQALRHV